MGSVKLMPISKKDKGDQNEGKMRGSLETRRITHEGFKQNSPISIGRDIFFFQILLDVEVRKVSVACLCVCVFVDGYLFVAVVC